MQVDVVICTETIKDKLVSKHNVTCDECMAEDKLSSISHAETEAKIGEFWDSHDFTEFDDPNSPDVPFEIAHSVRLDSELLVALEQQARRRGVELETLVNLWLQQKLDEQVLDSA